MSHLRCAMPALFFALLLLPGTGMAGAPAPGPGNESSGTENASIMGTGSNLLSMGHELALASQAPDSGASTSAPSTAPTLLEDPWEVKVKVYGWLPSIKGHAGRGRAVSSLDVSYSDVLHGLKKVESIVPVDIEARLGHWGVFADLLYAKVEDSSGRGPLKVNVVGEQTILELGGFYRVGTWPVKPGSDSTLSFDLLGGARYNRLEGSLGLQTPRRSISLGGTQEWWDPFVGPRVNWHAMDKLDLFARADVGGFGIENCSKFTWQFFGGAEYDFTKNFFVQLGYRLLDTDFERGSGRNHFVYDVHMAGPYFALGVKF